MHTFSQKQQPQPRTSSHFAPPVVSTLGPHHPLQLKGGNHPLHRLPQVNAEENETRSLTATPTPFMYNFGRIPVLSPSAVGVQPKLSVNAPGDIYEQEADRTADQVIHMPEAQILECGAAAADEYLKERKQQDKHDRWSIQRLYANPPGETLPPDIVKEALSSPGCPLDTPTRVFMEQRFGHNFSNVRIHTDSRASESAQTVNALAYTASNHIVFRENFYQPHSLTGRHLLAHELTHVIQQGAAWPGTESAPLNFLQKQERERISPRRVDNLRNWARNPGNFAGLPGRPAWGSLSSPEREIVLKAMREYYGEDFASQFEQYANAGQLSAGGLATIHPRHPTQGGVSYDRETLLREGYVPSQPYPVRGHPRPREEWIHPSGHMIIIGPEPETPWPSTVPRRIDPEVEPPGQIINERPYTQINLEGTNCPSRRLRGHIRAYGSGTIEIFMTGFSNPLTLRTLEGTPYGEEFVLYDASGRPTVNRDGQPCVYLVDRAELFGIAGE